MLMSLMLHPSISKSKNAEDLKNLTMKLLIDLCVSLTTENEFVFNNVILSSQEFLFSSSDRTLRYSKNVPSRNCNLTTNADDTL